MIFPKHVFETVFAGCRRCFHKYRHQDMQKIGKLGSKYIGEYSNTLRWKSGSVFGIMKDMKYRDDSMLSIEMSLDLGRAVIQ